MDIEWSLTLRDIMEEEKKIKGRLRKCGKRKDRILKER